MEKSKLSGKIPLNTRADRRAFWALINEVLPAGELERHLMDLPPTTRDVLQYHYYLKKSFKELVPVFKRSYSIILNHHNMGIFKLAKAIYGRLPAETEAANNGSACETPC